MSENGRNRSPMDAEIFTITKRWIVEISQHFRHHQMLISVRTYRDCRQDKWKERGDQTKKRNDGPENRISVSTDAGFRTNAPRADQTDCLWMTILLAGLNFYTAMECRRKANLSLQHS